jgi:hypothetical protein
MQKLARHAALLFAAAKAHEEWEIIADENGAPCVVRRKDVTGHGPSTPKELAEWFVETFPEKAAKILTSEGRTLH